MITLGKGHRSSANIKGLPSTLSETWAMAPLLGLYSDNHLVNPLKSTFSIQKRITRNHSKLAELIGKQENVAWHYITVI